MADEYLESAWRIGARFHYREELAPATGVLGRAVDAILGSCRMEEAVTPQGVHINSVRDGRFIFERCERCRRTTVSYWALEDELPLTIPASPFDD